MKDKKYHYVYQITDTRNGNIYIGKRTSYLPPEQDNEYYGSGKIIRRIILKHGTSILSKKIIKKFNSEKECSDYEASILTESFISRKDVYNIAPGYFGGDVFTWKSDIDKKITSKRISESGIMRFMDEGERKKCNVFKNITGDELKKRKKVWSNASKGPKNGRFKYHQKVYCVDKKTDKLIKIYDYAAQSEEDGFNDKYVLNCCKKVPYYHTHKGFKWFFEEDYLKNKKGT